MYQAVLIFHSLCRWIVLLLAIATVVASITGWKSKADWTPRKNKLSLFWLIAMDLQLLTGILLYAVLSPLTKAIFANFGAAMGDKVLRFFAVEHTTTMLLAIILMHVGRVLVRKARTHHQKNRRAAICFTLSLLLLLGGIPWPFLHVGRPLHSFF